MTSALDIYLAQLRRELRKHGLFDQRIVEEARGHLMDATEQAVRSGRSRDAAEREAIARFGAPKQVAMTFASERYRVTNWLLFASAAVVGMIIAYIDAQPGWDDAGVIAFSMFVVAGVFGMMAPHRPWLWALAIGIWIPLHAIARHPSLGSAAMLVVMAFPFAAAYAGMMVRRVLANTAAHEAQAGLKFHDRQTPLHYMVMSKRGWVNPELVAIASDPGSRLVPFLERVAPAPLGPLGQVESVSLLERESTHNTKKYRVVFGGHIKTVCTVTLRSDGKGVSLDWTRVATE